ncbi:MAG: tRNA lysidine(34) synthetase TilS [Spirochaetes bacterium]|nr:MAG: tRNA lysidine(34) synthetase TilS [Spirochaetota bacterium]
MSSTKSKKSSIVSRVSASLEYFGVKRGEKLLIGFSGGPDSTFLITSLNLIKEEWNFELSSVYVDHGIRERHELEDEINFIKWYSGKLGIPCYIEKIPDGQILKVAKERGISSEEYARNQRYSILYKLSAELKVSGIVLGHTYDDQTETLIMRFFAGSDFTGLSGIQGKRGMLIRPLITIKKNEIVSYLKQHHIRYRIDSTNLKDDYLRNKIRHNLIPKLQDIFPGYESALNTFAFKMRQLQNYTEGEIECRYNYIKVENGYKIDGYWFIQLPGFLRVRFVYFIFNKMQEFDNEPIDKLPYNFLRVLLDKDKLQKRKVILKGYGIKLFWNGDMLFYERDVVSTVKKGYLIKLEKNVPYNIDFLNISIKLSDVLDHNMNDDVLKLEKGSIREPLVLRTWREGDRIKIKGGKKSVKKVFQELKIPEDKRNIIPLLVDREGIKVILGKPLGYGNVSSYGILVKREKDKSLNIIIRITEK